MVCVIFVAGHNDLLESEIANDVSGRFDKLKGVPKALLPAAASTDGTPSTILGRWWHLVNTRQILEVFLVTNANKFKVAPPPSPSPPPSPPHSTLTLAGVARGTAHQGLTRLPAQPAGPDRHD